MIISLKFLLWQIDHKHATLLLKLSQSPNLVIPILKNLKSIWSPSLIIQRFHFLPYIQLNQSYCIKKRSIILYANNWFTVILIYPFSSRYLILCQLYKICMSILAKHVLTYVGLIKQIHLHHFMTLQDKNFMSSWTLRLLCHTDTIWHFYLNDFS